MKRQAAFSLLELLSVLALLCIGLLVIAPSWQHWLADQRVQVASREIVTAVQLARWSAIVQGQAVTLCAKGEGDKCGADWQRGMLVCRGESKEACTAEMQAIREFKAIPHVVVEWRGFPETPQIVFNPQGMLQVQNGRFIISARVGDHDLKRTLLLSKTGRLRSE